MLFLSKGVFVGRDELQEKGVYLRDFLGGCGCDERRSWTACSIMVSAQARVSTSEGVGGGRGGERLAASQLMQKDAKAREENTELY